MASVRTVTKTRAILIDLAIGLGIPILQFLCVQYIVERHRYNIFEDIGCLGETYETALAVVLFHLPPILIDAFSACYCILSILSFYRSRAQFKELLCVNKNLNLNRYVLLMVSASTDLLLTTPLSIWVLWVNMCVVGLSLWISWVDTHSNFSRVVQVPGIYWRADPYSVASLEPLRWATVVCALLFFAYFGFAEAIKNYCGAFQFVAKRMGYSTANSGLSSTGRVFLLFPSPPFLLYRLSSHSATSKLPHVLLLARSHPPRLHLKRHHAETRLVRLVLRHVRVVSGHLAARL
ncbi:pheromone A receptor-domain-containing protein [Mycena leptocephala]|nr:pheromone A receptor-domain-containing protein [Mycena leptocephala]